MLFCSISQKPELEKKKAHADWILSGSASFSWVKKWLKLFTDGIIPVFAHFAVYFVHFTASCWFLKTGTLLNRFITWNYPCIQIFMPCSKSEARSLFLSLTPWTKRAAFQPNNDLLERSNLRKPVFYEAFVMKLVGQNPNHNETFL